MTPRERVIRTLHGEQLHPLPSLLNIPVEAARKRPLDCSDLRQRFPNDIDVIRPLRFACSESMDFQMTDPLGLRWKLECGEYRAVSAPICKNARDLASLKLPAYQTCRDEFDSIGAFCEANPRFVMLQAPFSLLGELVALLGFENAKRVIHEEAAEFVDFIQRLHSAFMVYLLDWCRSDVDAICLSDCRFTDDGELITLPYWKEYVLPYLKEAVQLIQNADKYAIISEMGDVRDMLPSLKNIGVDAVRYDCTASDSAVLAERWAQRLVFMPVFPVHQFAESTPEVISEEILKIRRAFDGVCAIFPECDIQPDSPYRNITTAVLSWRRQMPVERLY